MSLGYDGYGSGWGSGAEGGSFPNPFLDLASTQLPTTVPHALRLVEFIALSDGTYFQALNRVVSYFLTSIEIDGVSDDEQARWEEYLNEALDARYWLHLIGLDALVYGNAFVSVLSRFRRHLVCPRCKSVEVPLSVAHGDPAFRYRWSDWRFCATCPRCKYDGPFDHVDRKVGERDACVVKRWNPHDIELLWDPFTDRCRYVWKIPEDHRRLIREGRLWALEHAPWEVVECVKAGRHLLFEDGVVLHVKEDALAGFRNRGWGISRILANFRQTWYVQVLRRYNEAIALDYVIPFRLITPEPGDKTGTGAGDALLNFSMGSFAGQVRTMLRRRRRDPASMHVLPFPVKYQLLGGEARQLAPTDLLNQGLEVQLNNIGIPVDLWKGSLQVQAAPVALRLFETSWSWLPHVYAKVLRFLVEGVSRTLSWQKPKAKLEPVTHADDITAIQAKLQLMMGGQISPTTALKGVRLSYRDEVDRTVEDQRYQAEAQAKAQSEMEAQSQMEQMVAAGGQPGQPGQPGQGQPGQAAQGQPQPGQPGPAQASADQVAAGLVVGDNEKISPQEMWERADTAAQQLLGMDAGQRASALRKIKASNPNVHPFILQRLEQLRAEAGRQGQSAVLQQTFGGGH